MLAIEMKKMLLTHSSTAKQEEKIKERGSCQTLCVLKEDSDLVRDCFRKFIDKV